MVNATLGALIVAVTVYLVMHFLVPLSLDDNARSLIGAGVAFIAAAIVPRYLSTRKSWRSQPWPLRKNDD